MFDAQRFLREYNVPTLAEGHKHARAGWIQIKCPFCGSREGWHLGFNLESGYWHCWRCEWHSNMDVVRALLSCDEFQARRVIQTYTISSVLDEKRTVTVRKNNTARLPLGAGPLLHCHKKYLLQRGFDDRAVQELVQIWNVLGTGSIGEWKFRLVIPIMFHGITVSFQTRSIVEDHPLRYKSCPKDKEVVNIKHTLYGFDQAKQIYGDGLVIVTEGILDVWKLGRGAVATYGVDYSAAQLNLLAEFKHIAIIFDNDQPGRNQATNLAADLNNLGRRSVMIQIDQKDPGDMSLQDARSLMSEISSYFDVPIRL